MGLVRAFCFRVNSRVGSGLKQEVSYKPGELLGLRHPGPEAPFWGPQVGCRFKSPLTLGPSSESSLEIVIKQAGFLVNAQSEKEEKILFGKVEAEPGRQVMKTRKLESGANSGDSWGLAGLQGSRKEGGGQGEAAGGCCSGRWPTGCGGGSIQLRAGAALGGQDWPLLPSSLPCPTLSFALWRGESGGGTRRAWDEPTQTQRSQPRGARLSGPPCLALHPCKLSCGHACCW